MTCHKKPRRQTWTKYCKNHPDCSSCISTYDTMSMCGSPTGAGGKRDQLYWKLEHLGEWKALTDPEIETVKEEKRVFEATLPQDPLEKRIAIASFYAERNLELLRINELDAADSDFAEEMDPRVALELSQALREAGFFEAALRTCDHIPDAIFSTNAMSMQILGSAMLNRGRILEDLKRFDETETAFAYARHMYVAAGMLLH